MPPNRNERIRSILDPESDRCPHLECDGFTRVASHLLFLAHVPHHAYVGTATWNGGTIPLHYWIVLPSGDVVDYRLRMWLGDDAPHGVFDPATAGVTYRGERVALSTPGFLIDVLRSPPPKEE